MVIIPAIDLKDGHCVRLRQGRLDESVVFSADPLAVCERWRSAGAHRVHIVDIDGAIQGKPVHRATISNILKHNPGLSLEVGGGIRDEETIEAYLQAGAEWVILGTAAAESPDFVARMCELYPGRIIVGLDERKGYVATSGWKQQTGSSALQLARDLAELPLAAFIHTDIERDGMMSGVNIESSTRLAKSVSIPVIASGGVRRLDDIRALNESKCVHGVIVGRALYQGDIDLADALSVV